MVAKVINLAGRRRLSIGGRALERSASRLNILSQTGGMACGFTTSDGLIRAGSYGGAGVWR